MAQDKQLPQLDSATISNDADLFLTTQSGVAKKITAGLVRSKLLGQPNTWAAFQTSPARIGVVSMGSTQSLPGGEVQTKVNFNASPEIDPFSLWDGTNKVWLLDKPGIWRVNAYLFGAAVTNGFDFYMTAKLSDGGDRRLAEVAGTGLNETLTGSCMMESDGTLSVQLNAANTSATAFNIGNAYFEIHYLGTL